MAIYHFHVTQVSRGKGQSAIAAAAYRAGERLQDHYYGEYADYTAKGGVVYTEIIAPDYVPESFHDRETLWNAVEKVEKHPKAQLAWNSFRVESISQSEKYPWVWKAAWMDASGNKVRKQ